MRTRFARWPMVVTMTVGLLAAATALMAQEAANEAPATQPAADPTALLKVIPADATAFVAIRNLKELDADIVGIAGQLGFPMGPEGMFPAPLEWLKQSMMISSGLNENDGAAIVLLDCSKVKTMDELPDQMVMFIPASNPKELLKSLNAEETTGGVYKLDMAGAPSVAIIKGNYIVAAKAPISTETGTPPALAAVAKAQGEGVVKAMSPDRVQAYAKQDIFVWLNLQTVSDDLRKGIADGLSDVFKGLAAMSGRAASQPSEDPTGDAVKKMAQFINDGEEVSVGLLVSSRVGLNLSFYFRVKPDCELANAIAAQQPAKGSLLAGLPNEAAIFTFATVVPSTPESLDQARKTVESLAAKAQQFDPDPGSPLTAEGLKPLIDSYISLLGNSKRVAIMVSDLSVVTTPKPIAKKTEGEAAPPPAPQPAEGAFGLAVVVEVKDSKAFKAEMKKVFDEAKQLVSGVAKADGMEQAKLDKILEGFKWTEVGGSLDMIRVDLSQLPDVKPEDIEKVKTVLGPDGVALRITTVGEKYVVIAMGGGEKRLTEITALVEKNQSPLAKSKNISRIASRLQSGPRVMEFYLDFGYLVELVKTVANRLDTPLPINVSLKNAAPMAVTTANIGKTAQQVELLVPIELIRSGYAAVTQAMMGAMMGGGGGGSPGSPEMGGSKQGKPNEGGEDEGQPKTRKPRRIVKPQPTE